MERIQQERILFDETEKQKKELEYQHKLKHVEIKRAIDNWKVAKLEKEELQLHEKHILEKNQRLFKYTVLFCCFLHYVLTYLCLKNISE